MRGNGEGIVSLLAFELAPAGIFGSAVAFGGATGLAVPQLSSAPLAAGGAAFGAAWLVLRRIGSKRRHYVLPQFDAADFEPDERIDDVEELVLALGQPHEELAELILDEVFEAPRPDELVLEDILEALEPESRVVQLFQPKDAPTAGELQERIERHFRSARHPVPDATEELREALSLLRQSLR
jgi:hypothetical protein